MEKSKMIEILMADRRTKAEAERFIRNGEGSPGGGVIWDSPEEWIDSLKESGVYEGQTPEDTRRGAYPGVSVVEYEGREYTIEYIL